MDKIWYRNTSKSEVIGRCGRDEKNRMTTHNRQKSNAKKNKNKNPANIFPTIPLVNQDVYMRLHTL